MNSCSTTTYSYTVQDYLTAVNLKRINRSNTLSISKFGNNAFDIFEEFLFYLTRFVPVII